MQVRRRAGIVSAVRTLLAGVLVAALVVALGVALAQTRHPVLRDRVPVAAGDSPPTGPGLQICGTPAVQPVTFPESCGSGGRFWTNIRWTSWRPTAADAVGEYWIEDLRLGTSESYPVRLHLARPAGTGSRRVFTRLTMTYSAQSPDSATGHRVTFRVTTRGLDVLEEDL